MILFISKIGASLPIVHRMRQEGIDTKIYINKESYRTCYDGIVDKIELKELKKEILAAEKVIFDSDVDLGALGDCLDDKSICRPFKFNEDKILEVVDMKKKDVSGLKIIVEMWFNGKEPILYTYCLPGQKWLTGDLGLEMSSQTNCLWIAGETGIITDKLDALVPLLIKNSYVGPVSLDCVIGRDKELYFNNFHIGLRYDSIFCLLALTGASISSFLIKGGLGTHKGFACSERVTIAPYPYTNDELLKGIAKGVKLKTDLGNGFWCQDIKKEDDILKCAGNDGLLGIMTGTGPRIEEGFGKVYKAIRKLEVEAPLQFRIDGLRETAKKLKKLRSWNVN